MNSVNKTLYIPLYGKAYVGGRGLFLRDEMAEKIWSAEGFPLKGKSASKWLAFYMGIRAAVFDEWVSRQLAAAPDAVVVHIGCGLDSRVVRVAAGGNTWYDVDFPQVIAERKRYFSESGQYRMLAADVRDHRWLKQISETGTAVVVMEGVSMYLTPTELQSLMKNLSGHFSRVLCLMDCYSELAAKLSRYKNPLSLWNPYGTAKENDCPDINKLKSCFLIFRPSRFSLYLFYQLPGNTSFPQLRQCLGKLHPFHSIYLPGQSKLTLLYIRPEAKHE